MLYKIQCFLFRLTHISYWSMNEDYDENYDEWLIKSLKCGTEINRYSDIKIIEV